MSLQKSINLNDRWVIKTDPDNIGIAEKWYAKFPKTDIVTAKIPGNIRVDIPKYIGNAWYKRVFEYNSVVATHERVVLRFECVSFISQVWLNGEFVGAHEGGESPFEFEVTEKIRLSSDNILIVLVDPVRFKTGFPYGGIIGDVTLNKLPSIRIKDVFVIANPDSGDLHLKTKIMNATAASVEVILNAMITSSKASDIITSEASPIKIQAACGETDIEVSMKVDNPRLWSPDDPYLYNAFISSEVISDNNKIISSNYKVRYGFRNFSVGEDGFFRINGKRIFLRSSHTGNHYPIGINIPPSQEMMYKDLIYAKTLGFNMIRFIATAAIPAQLDFCDEIGLMVYEEPFSSWFLDEKSPDMKKYYNNSLSNLILRDRNHACLTILGLLNETRYGALTQHVATLIPFIRKIDPTRLVLYNSGRWDGNHEIGSVSNPYTNTWQQLWSLEADGAKHTKLPEGRWFIPEGTGGRMENAGDMHMYPHVPQQPEDIKLLRTYANDTKPAFISEYGIGSLENAIRIVRLFEQHGAQENLEDYTLYKTMADRYLEEWDRYNMGDVYPYPDHMLADSERIHSKWRAECFNIVRSNPSFCGYSVTATVDQGYFGEGVWTTWREFKPEVTDVFVVGHAPLLWCLFIESMHVYSGQQFKVEAVLANEDILKPGTYPVSFKIAGKEGVVWEKKMDFVIPEPEAGKSVPLASQVMAEYVVINTSEDGEFSFCAHMEKGGAPAGGIKKFYVSNNDNLTLNDFEVTVFGVEMKTQQWLQSHGVKCNSYNKSLNQDKYDGEIILAGNLSNMNLADEDWSTLYDRIEKGSKVVFLSPEAFKKEDKITENLPFENKGECWLLENWLYHKEDVAKRSILFDDLQGGGILDWNYYSEVIPDYVFVKLDTPDQTEVASFSTGYDCEYRCFSGFVNGSYKKGKGSFMLNALRVEENLDMNPAADRLMLNIIQYAVQMFTNI